jgi:hypothetical protein
MGHLGATVRATHAVDGPSHWCHVANDPRCGSVEGLKGFSADARRPASTDYPWANTDNAARSSSGMLGEPTWVSARTQSSALRASFSR